MKKIILHNDQHLTYEELLDYHRGNLLNSEMHRLELHLTDCAFCREALEGLGQIDPAELEKYLATIRLKTGKPSVAIPWRMLAAAAAVVLLALTGWGISTLLKPEEEAAMAENTPAEAGGELPATPAVPDILPPLPADSSGPEAAEAAAAEAAVEVTTVETAASLPPEQPATTTAPADTSDRPVVTRPAAIEEELLAAEEAAPPADSLPAVSPVAEELLMAATAGEEPDTLAATGRKPAGERPAETAPPPETLAATRSKTATATDNTYRPAAPLRSPKAWQRYLKRNLRYPDEARDNQIEGEVVLQVVINPDGSVGHIRVTRPLGYGCDREAIRLVREGPAWQPATRNGLPVADTVEVVVPFKR